MRRARPQVLLFDVNETLLDLTPVKTAVNAILSDKAGASLWFSSLLHHALAMTVSDQYDDFVSIGAAVLQMLAKQRAIPLSAADAQEALAGMRTLTPHADVVPGLTRLKAAGYRLATLTNSSQQGVDAQLNFAALAPFFEQCLSVDGVRKFKPHRSTYEWAARSMQVAPNDSMLVAAHGWDVAGASWAGMQTAFIARPGQQIFPLAPPPDIVTLDLVGLADALDA